MKSKLSSVFDDLLDENRKRLDEMTDGGPAGDSAPPAPRPGATPARAPTISPPSPTRPKPRDTDRPIVLPAATQPPPGGDIPAEIAARISDLFPGGWRHEVTDRRREGDEIVVSCRLVSGDGRQSAKGTGRAPLGGGITGAFNGHSFRLKSKGGGEDAAFRQAMGKALLQCLEALS